MIYKIIEGKATLVSNIVISNRVKEDGELIDKLTKETKELKKRLEILNDIFPEEIECLKLVHT